MADIHDQAEQWAQANAQDPRAQDILAKSWASKNPQDPRASQIMAKFGSPQRDLDANSGDLVSRIAATAGKPLDPNTQAAMRASADQAESPKGAQQLATTLLPGAASRVPVQGALGRIGMAGAQGGAAAVGMGNHDQSASDKLTRFLAGGTIGAGLQGGAEGLGKLGNTLMQSAVGMRKNYPEVGTRLANQGLIGTRSMLADQVESKLPQAEQKVQDAVSNIQGEVPGNDITKAVAKYGTKFMNPDTGLPFEGKEASLKQVRDLTDQLSQVPSYSPKAMLALKRASDYEGYTASGNPATSLKAELEQAQANQARESLSKLSGGATADALADEQALILANKPLNKPDTIHQGVGSSLFFGKYPGKALMESAAGQASVKGSKTLSNPYLRQVPDSLFKE